MWPPQAVPEKGIVADILKPGLLSDGAAGAWLESSWVYFVSGDR